MAVRRHQSCIVRYRDQNWAPRRWALAGAESELLQHEYDHLDGILFIDKISRLRRTLYDSKVKKWLKRKSAV